MKILKQKRKKYGNPVAEEQRKFFHAPIEELPNRLRSLL